MTILMYLLLVFFGWLSICGASYNFETEELLSPGGRPISRAHARGSCWALCAYSRQSSLR